VSSHNPARPGGPPTTAARTAVAAPVSSHDVGDTADTAAEIAAGPAATAQLTATLYDELCAIAHRLRRTERDDHTLQTTAIVHEAFLRLARQEAAAWQGRQHFLAAAAQTMRRVLVDYARERHAAKRDGGMRTTLLSLEGDADDADTLDVLALHDVLDRLATLDARKARVVELRIFGGFDIPEIADILGISRNTATRDWRFAKGWLACHLTPVE
jgi:RNA polymerase sigma factor (TIGR02999 family)